MRTRTFPPIFLRGKGARHEQEFCPCGRRYQGPMAEPHGRPLSRIAERPPSILFSPSPAAHSRGRGCEPPSKSASFDSVLAAIRACAKKTKEKARGYARSPFAVRPPYLAWPSCFSRQDVPRGQRFDQLSINPEVLIG